MVDQIVAAVEAEVADAKVSVAAHLKSWLPLGIAFGIGAASSLGLYFLL